MSPAVGSTANRLVTFLSDFGTDDEFAAVCKGVVLQAVPGATIIDVTHAIAPGDVRGGALALLRAIPYFPVGVHLAVVDPGVGTDRNAVVIETADGRHFVGPDNGLLSPSVAISGGAVAAVVLEPQAWGLGDPSPTFWGRDVFAPAAAVLCGGESMYDLGRRVDPAELTPLLVPLAQVAGGQAHGVVLWVDRFGNAQTNITPEDLAEAGAEPGDHISFHHGNRRERMAFVRTFADVEQGRLLAFVDSTGQVAIAVNGASAAAELGLTTGAPVRISRAGAPL
ncbi:MAG: SAM-dependent chlorinase/fluorinase [Acidimicrobiia bacterium]|nr:SAM-dependent chlorinase/fluorinase [Acidimicrobiia bacterium]